VDHHFPGTYHPFGCRRINSAMDLGLFFVPVNSVLGNGRLVRNHLQGYHYCHAAKIKITAVAAIFIYWHLKNWL